ncbi:hypothetical protein TRFO_33526 [Tritrichomonas foetus]|uniref:Uncharacterized protein n=1 Tax=Tritrichomonas foetus TaxID=1144522 RepID=A0A1J4JLE1_9EUKA|nr:hypothetical protein TRFO_33526 [Tritrichomonas foetus]|eukprot:OHS99928.1 hypothetical protein TRFO_33526 [Tritrichomonas foetus]
MSQNLIPIHVIHELKARIRKVIECIPLRLRKSHKLEESINQVFEYQSGNCTNDIFLIISIEKFFDKVVKLTPKSPKAQNMIHSVKSFIDQIKKENDDIQKLPIRNIFEINMKGDAKTASINDSNAPSIFEIHSSKNLNDDDFTFPLKKLLRGFFDIIHGDQLQELIKNKKEISMIDSYIENLDNLAQKKMIFISQFLSLYLSTVFDLNDPAPFDKADKRMWRIFYDLNYVINTLIPNNKKPQSGKQQQKKVNQA